MYFKKFLLLAAIITCFYSNLAKSDIKILELQTKEGTQLVQVKEDNNVFLPQETILSLGGKDYLRERYIHNLSKIEKGDKRFINISDGNSLDNTTDIEKLCRNFIYNNRAKLNIDINNLVLRRAEFAGNRWYVFFDQVYNGILVKTAGVRFTIAKNGNIQTFKATYFDDITLNKANLKYTISTLEAETAISIGLPRPNETYTFNKMNDGKMVIVPYLLNGAYTYRVAYEYEIENTTEFYTALVDANTGSLLQRINHTLEFVVKGDVYGANPKDALEEKNISNLKVNVNDVEYISDRKGNIDFSTNLVGANYSTKLEGKFAKMYTTDELNKSDGVIKKEYNFNGVIGDDGIYMQGKTSNFDEIVRTLYYHTNLAHDYIANLDGSFNNYLTKFPCIVELLKEEDIDKFGSKIIFNAFSSGDKSISFYSANHNKVFVGRHPSVLYHEYGHSVNYVLYRDWGENGRMISRTCNEALADITSAFILDESNIFKNCVADGYEQLLTTYNLVRNVDNNYKYPDFLIHECHYDSQILSGALWDLRKAIGLEDTEYFVHFARRETPDGFTLDAALSNWFEAIILASDQGLGEFEYFDDILNAFDKHNIGFNLLMQTRFEHKEPADNNNLVAVPVVASISNSYVPTQVSEVYLNYYTNWDSEVKSILLNNDGINFSGEFPAPEKPTRYYYYFTMKNPYSNELVASRENYILFVGYEKSYENLCEATSGWGVEEFDNTMRGWTNQAPKFVFVTEPEMILRPNGDHTTGAGKCWETGAEMISGGDYKTLQGTSILVSPIIAINATYPVLSYYYFLLNSKVSSGSLKVEISFDGGETWVTMKEYSKAVVFPKGWNWQRDYIHLDKFTGGTNLYNNMKIRFVAFGNANNGYFTALIDDIRIFNTSVPGSINVEEYNNSISIIPNPANSDILLDFNVQLSDPDISIFDALGNKIYNINMLGEFKVCPLDIRNFVQGIYFLKVISNGKTYTSTLNVVK